MTDANDDSVTLFRPVGEQELELIKQTDNSSFPPRLPEQPIFYPVLTREYAIQIARDWNAKYKEPKRGYVTRFRVRKSFLAKYEVRTVGGIARQEYWIPAEDLDEFNQNIVGKIEVIAEYKN